MPDALVEVIASEPKIVKYLDMPLQHASDRLLKAMRRGGNARSMRALLAKLRKRIPGVALRTSLIVGLPGETIEARGGSVRASTWRTRAISASVSPE